MIAHTLEVAFKILSLDDHRTSAVVGMKTERLGLKEVLVEEQDDMVLLIIDQAKRADTTWFESEVLEHAFGAGEREFAWGVLACGKECSFEALLEVVDSQVVLAVEADEVVLCTLVVAHEDVLAMHTAVVLPPAFGLFDSLTLGVVVAGKRYLIIRQVCQYLFLSCHNYYRSQQSCLKITSFEDRAEPLKIALLESAFSL